MPARPSAFTLIELLVVITIIVVLLALLTPALDKAIYEAELAVCGAQQKTIAGGVTAYAFDHRRSYPYRGHVRNPEVGDTLPQIICLSSGGVGINKTGKTFDDRVMLRPYMVMRLFQDPLMPVQIDFENTPAERGLNINNDLWVGFGYNNRRGMYRVGDRWRWSEPNNNVESTLLYADQVDASPAFGGIIGSHPDSNNYMIPSRWDNDQMSAGASLGLPAGVINLQASYSGANVAAVGRIDRNFAHADGSVRRLADTHWQPAAERPRRLEKVPTSKAAAEGATAGVWKSISIID